MHSPLDSRQLRAFVCLARTASFTKTARELHLSQSAISHSLKALETEVECRLLDRVSKSVTLTQAGEQLLAHAEKILEEMDNARQGLKELAQWGHGRLRVGASPTVCQYILPNVLREFKESFPQCRIQIEPGDAPATMEQLRHNRIDLALALRPRAEDRLDFRALFQDELRFMVSPLHPWARAGRVQRSEITSQRFILYARTSYVAALIDAYFRRQSLVLPTSIELGNIEAIKELVKLGLGVSILAPWVARRELAEGSLCALPLGRRKLGRCWGILYRKGQRLSLAQETFIGLCTAVADNLQLRNQPQPVSVSIGA
jgi:DNA-binding transcriptional LysR family regulator